MQNAAELVKHEKKIEVVCLETGQRMSVAAWGEALAPRLALDPKSVGNRFYRVSRSHDSSCMHLYGMHWAIAGGVSRPVTCEKCGWSHPGSANG